MEAHDQIPVINGFRVSAVDAGIYAHFGKPTRPDLALIAADLPCAAAGLFTTNRVKAAPVLVCEDRLRGHAERIRAVLINAGCANACTGGEGLRNAGQTAEWVAEAIGSAPDQVLMMSTGVIGTQLPMERMRVGIAAAAVSLKADGWCDASTAIMTTDTRPKRASLTVNGVTIAGIAKGAGMIAPNMATLLALVVTDAKISPSLLQKALSFANDQSFNRVVIDGDMSTNDTLLALASGASGVAIDEEHLADFQHGLAEVCRQLAWKIVEDGEGVTRRIVLNITGARTSPEARQIGNTIATSPLVKTAFYGGDANWGRILAAAGRAGVELDQSKLSLWYDDLQLVEHGTPLTYDEARANAIAGKTDEAITVRLDLGLGDRQAQIWTCDLSHDYVSINGHYRT